MGFSGDVECTLLYKLAPIYQGHHQFTIVPIVTNPSEHIMPHYYAPLFVHNFKGKRGTSFLTVIPPPPHPTAAWAKADTSDFIGASTVELVK